MTVCFKNSNKFFWVLLGFYLLGELFLATDRSCQSYEGICKVESILANFFPEIIIEIFILFQLPLRIFQYKWRHKCSHCIMLGLIVI